MGFVDTALLLHATAPPYSPTPNNEDDTRGRLSLSRALPNVRELVLPTPVGNTTML